MEVTLNMGDMAGQIAQKLSEEIRQIVREEMAAFKGMAPKKRIRGNKELAKELGVDVKTVTTWKSDGVLDDAILAQYNRVIIYDFEGVLTALKGRSGRGKRFR